MKPGARAKILPPLLRESVRQRQPSLGDHVVAYQGYTTFKRFFPFLSAIPSKVMVYGFNEERIEGNLHFKKNSETGFLDDLSSCRYVVCGGSHTLVSEALFYGKPVISFPIKNAFEQFLNALYIERLGYGRYFTGFRPRPEIIPAFEARLDQLPRRHSEGKFLRQPGNFRTGGAIYPGKEVGLLRGGRGGRRWDGADPGRTAPPRRLSAPGLGPGADVIYGFISLTKPGPATCP